MGMRLLAISLAVVAAIPSPALAQQVGDWVLSRWRGSGQYFPGVIVARSGDRITVEFDDGAVETQRLRDVRPYDWRPGSAVECRWTDGAWYPAHILKMGSDGTSLLIRYDEDGIEQRTKTKRCRAW